MPIGKSPSRVRGIVIVYRLDLWTVAHNLVSSWCGRITIVLEREDHVRTRLWQPQLLGEFVSFIDRSMWAPAVFNEVTDAVHRMKDMQRMTNATIGIKITQRCEIISPRISLPTVNSRS